MYHAEKTRESGADAAVAVMSGNFVQRCEPAFFRKQARAEAAVRGGIDLVIELPVRFSTGSAEKFAYGGVYLLDMCGVCDILSFGSESGSITELNACAEKLIEADRSGEIAKAVRGSESFARARQKTVGSVLLSEPNNILAVEYIKALKKLNSKIKPFTVKRTDGYHASASEIRKKIPGGLYDGLPDFTADIIKRETEAGRAPAELSRLERILLAFLRNAKSEDFSGIYGINEKEGFGNRLLSAAKASSLEEAFGMIKSKKYALSTVKRALLSAYLRIPDDKTMPEYIRPLAFNEKGRLLLKAVSRNIQVVGNLAELKNDPHNAVFADEERRATALFGLATPEIQPGYSEFTDKISPEI